MKRITKKNGIIAFAYINRTFAIAYTLQHGISFAEEDYDEFMKHDWFFEKFPDEFANISYYSTPENAETEISSSGLEIVSHIASDGLYTALKDQVELFSDKHFDALLNYHIKTANLSSCLGASCHNLIIAKKA